VGSSPPVFATRTHLALGGAIPAERHPDGISLAFTVAQEEGNREGRGAKTGVYEGLLTGAIGRALGDVG